MWQYFKLESRGCDTKDKLCERRRSKSGNNEGVLPLFFFIPRLSFLEFLYSLYCVIHLNSSYSHLLKSFLVYFSSSSLTLSPPLFFPLFLRSPRHFESFKLSLSTSSKEYKNRRTRKIFQRVTSLSYLKAKERTRVEEGKSNFPFFMI